jgi:hypothetical protein
MDTFENIRNQWSTFLDQPGARTALLQTGLSLMQPPHFGDTPTAQVGRAIGAGGEAVTRQAEAQSKQELAQAKGETLRANMGQAGAKLGLEYFKRQSIEKGQQASRQAMILREYLKDKDHDEKTYANEVKRITDANAFKPAAQREKIPPRPVLMSLEDWVRAKGPAVVAGFGLTGPEAKQPAQSEEDLGNP